MPGFQPGVTINEESQLAVTTGLRASSYEPGFRDLALPLNHLEDFQCVDTRGMASSVSKISVFPTEISVSGLGILLYEYFSPNTGMTVGWIMAVRMASSCIACCIFHIISIPFNCSDTAFRVAEAMIGTKVIIFFVAPCLLCFSKFGARTHPRIFGYFSSQKPGWNFSYDHEPKAKCGSGNQASQVNHAHVKRPVSQKFQPLFRPEIKLLLTSHNPKNLANRPAHFFVNWQRSIMLSAKLLKLLSRMWTSRAFCSCIIGTFEKWIPDHTGLTMSSLH